MQDEIQEFDDWKFIFKIGSFIYIFDYVLKGSKTTIHILHVEENGSQFELSLNVIKHFENDLMSVNKLFSLKVDFSF